MRRAVSLSQLSYLLHNTNDIWLHFGKEKLGCWNSPEGETERKNAKNPRFALSLVTHVVRTLIQCTERHLFRSEVVIVLKSTNYNEQYPVDPRVLLSRHFCKSFFHTFFSYYIDSSPFHITQTRRNVTFYLVGVLWEDFEPRDTTSQHQFQTISQKAPGKSDIDSGDLVRP